MSGPRTLEEETYGWQSTREPGTQHLIPIREALNRILDQNKTGTYSLNGTPSPEGWVSIAEGGWWHALDRLTRARLSATSESNEGLSPEDQPATDELTAAAAWADDQIQIVEPRERDTYQWKIAYGHKLMELMDRRSSQTRRGW